jgi:hypothetical protein
MSGWSFTHASILSFRRILTTLFCFAILLGCSAAQDTSIPHLVKFTGGISGVPSGTASVVFALYKEQTGGAPLWQEVQTVTLDAAGHYTVLLGARSATGIPVDVFSSNEARWLGVQFQGQAEQARVLLVSVPYAIKASDAETLGGLPPSAFLRSDAQAAAQSGAYINTAAVTSAVKGAVAAISTSGTIAPGNIPMFSDTAGDLSASALYQSGLNVGVGTSAPATAFNVAGQNPTLRVDNYSNTVGDSPNFNFLSARGALGSPQASQSNDNLGQFAAAGYTGSAFPGSKVKVTFLATENWSPTANGTAMTFQTTKNGTTARTERMRIDNTGNVGIGTTTPTSPLTVAGAIQSTAGGFVFPDNSTQKTAAVSGVALSSPDNSVTVSGSAQAPTVAVNTQTIQKRVSSACPTGQAVASVNADGSVNCVAVTSVSGGGTNGPMFLALYGDGGELTDAGALGAAGTRLHTDQPLTVTDVTYTASDAGSGVCTPALVRLTNGTIYEDVAIPVPTASYNTADHAVVFPAGSDISLALTQAAYCGTNYTSLPPSSIWGSIRYRVANTGEATTCPPNLTLVNGSCVDTKSDAQNCGSAGNACGGARNTTATCSNGTCGVGECKPGYGDCDGNPVNGCEVNFTNNANNCGYCGDVCAVGPVTNGTGTGCSNSTCQVTCNPGWQQCYYGSTGCTVNTANDVNNCGACGNTCAAGQQCTNSTCTGGSSASSGTSVEIFVSPSAITMGSGHSQTFSAIVGNATSTAVTWSIQETAGGSYSAPGAYIAPSVPGTYHVVATSQADSRAKAVATVTVVNTAPLPPVFTSTPPLTAAENQQYTYTISTVDPAGGSVSYQLLATPGAGMTGNVVSWYPYNQRDLYDFTVVATTTSGGTASQSWTVVPAGTISGTRRYTYVAESGSTVTVPEDLTASSPSALEPNPDGTYTSLPGTGTADGRFTVDNVPAGNYMLQYGAYSHWTASSTVDLSYDALGRSDYVWPSGTPHLSTAMTGLATTQASDYIAIYAPNVNCLQYPSPPAGLTTWTSTVQWNCPLLDATKDNVYVTQLSNSQIGSYNVAIAKKFAGPLQVTMPDSTTTTLNVPLADLPQSSTIRLNIKGSAFAALHTSTNPAATSYYSDFWVMALPDAANRGVYGTSMQLVDFTTLPQLGVDADLGNVSYGNPFPNYTAFVAYNEMMNVSYLAPGATTSANYKCAIGTEDINFPTATKPLVPFVGPATSPQINGTSLFTAQTLNTVTPTLSWSAPSIGTATGYLVGIIRLSASGGSTVFGSGTYFYTNSNSLVIPAGTVLQGGTYMVLIRAYYEPGTDFPTAPYRYSLPMGFADLVSAAITISVNAPNPAPEIAASTAAVRIKNSAEPAPWMERAQPVDSGSRGHQPR